MDPVKVLFVCTGNSCRSIMAEALLRHLAGDCYQVLSAGSRPAGIVHPATFQCLTVNDIPIAGLHSKSWDEYEGQPLDLVITVCDRAAAEICPIFPGDPLRIHWSIADPAPATGTDAEREAEFQATCDQLRACIEKLLGKIDARGSANLLPTDLRSLSDTKAD